MQDSQAKNSDNIKKKNAKKMKEYFLQSFSASLGTTENAPTSCRSISTHLFVLFVIKYCQFEKLKIYSSASAIRRWQLENALLIRSRSR